ncbi:MAG: helix-turn-helix transcriptional regulator [Paraclostridium sordellii]
MTIGRKLKQARLKKELTQENVANILNVSRTTISN